MVSSRRCMYYMAMAVRSNLRGTLQNPECVCVKIHFYCSIVNKPSNPCFFSFLPAGCKGNENRFTSVEECVNTCGGYEPEPENGFCATVQCDKHAAAFHKAKGCIPVVARGECCPSSWDCSKWNHQRLQRKNECFFANDKYPNGKFYAIGEDMREVNRGCTSGCTCIASSGGDAQVLCAESQCGFYPEPQTATKCSDLYDGLEECCSIGFKCDADLQAMAVCQLDNNVTAVVGEKIYNPKGNNPCESCICKGDGNLECQDMDCGLSRESRLVQGCTPVYQEGVCCPIDWVCPLPEAEVKLLDEGSMPPPPISSSGSVVCPPGVDARQDFVDYVTLPAQIEKLDRIAKLGRTTGLTPVQPFDSNAGDGFIDPCLGSRPPEGPCEPYMDKWSFDLSSLTCVEYKTSNLGGAKVNSFDIKEECVHACHHHIPKVRECRAKQAGDVTNSGSRNDRCMPRNKYRFNEATGKCEDFSRLGCRSNHDSYASLEECEAMCGSAVASSGGPSEFPGKAPECALSTVVS